MITCFGADGKKNPGSRNNRFTTFGGLLGSNGSFVEGSVVQLAGYDHGIQYIACGLGTLAETAADDFGWNLGDPGSSSGSTVTVLFQGFSSSRKLILTGALGTILRFLSSVLGVYMVKLQAKTERVIANILIYLLIGGTMEIREIREEQFKLLQQSSEE